MKHLHTISVKCILLILLFGFGLILASNLSRPTAKTQAAGIREKRIASVMVEENDTIWSIAKAYYTDECGSLSSYVKEIKACNSLKTNTIYAGYNLMVPMWVSESEATAYQVDHLLR